MKLFKLLILLIFTSTILFPQSENKSPLIENSVYTDAPTEVKNSKPLLREWWFWEQRAYPDGNIPDDALLNAYNQKMEMRQQGKINRDITWVSLGPTPGHYFNAGNISSRVVTGAYHPDNPDIIYIGAANGGVWKTEDGGQNWTPLTDSQPSLSMGSLAIDEVNPDIIYAGTGEATYSRVSYYGMGLLKSTNGGENWQHITAGLPDRTYFSRLKISPADNTFLIAAMGEDGLYNSNDSGESWRIVLNGRTDDVIFSPTGDTSFAVGSGIGLQRSIDGGRTFSDFGSGLPNGNRTHIDLCKKDPSVMAAVVYFESSDEVDVFKSTNYGESWFELVPNYGFNGNQGWYDLYIRINPVEPNEIYVGTKETFRSTNGGTSFQNITHAITGGPTHIDQHYLFFHPTDVSTFIALSDGGVYRTTDRGDNWQNLNTNLTLTQFYRITASPFDPSRIFGGTQDNGMQESSTSLEWNGVFRGDGGELKFNQGNGNFIVAERQFGYLNRSTNGGSSWLEGEMDGIDTGEKAAWMAPILVDPRSAGSFYVARERVYQTTNNGANWFNISDNVSGNSAITFMEISKSDPDKMYAAVASLLYITTNGGVDWNFVSTQIPNLAISSVYVHPENSNVALVTLSGFSEGEKVFKTTNNGEDWSNISGNLPNTPVNDLFIYTESSENPNTYFIATDIGVFLTEDNGQTWFEIDSGLPNTVIMHLDYSSHTKMLRAGTHGRGVYEAYIDLTIPVELSSFNAELFENNVYLNWTTATETNNRGFEIERKLKNQNWEKIDFVEGNGTTTDEQSYIFNDDISDINYDGRILYRLKQIDYDGSFDYSKQVYVDVNNLPDKITLHQNYPNPFNPVTTIKYEIKNESSVKLKIYNTLGEVVDVLTDEIQSAGSHKINWNASGFTSGVYFYELEVNDIETGNTFREMKKIIYMK